MYEQKTIEDKFRKNEYYLANTFQGPLLEDSLTKLIESAANPLNDESKRLRCMDLFKAVVSFYERMGKEDPKLKAYKRIEKIAYGLDDYRKRDEMILAMQSCMPEIIKTIE